MSFNPVAKFVHGNPLMIDFTDTATHNSGDVLVIGSKLGILHDNYTPGTVSGGAVIAAISAGRAVYDVAKNQSDSFSDRATVFFNSTSNKADSAMTATNGGFTLGVAIGNNGTTSTVQRVDVGILDAGVA
jgi:predicted RecA/RadA family phage recombinase